MATLVVSSNADSGVGTLRDAITQANTNTDSSNLITFSISSAQPITPATVLPSITKSNLTINGTIGGNGRAEINGSNAALTSGSGLTVAGSATNIQIQNLAINRFKGNGITLGGSGGSLISGSYIGSDATGQLLAGNTGNGINVTSPNNTIGGFTASDRNVITGNVASQVVLAAGANQTLIVGNYVGVNSTGTAALGQATNLPDGVVIGSLNNTIGGSSTSARNLISGNNYGINLSATTSTDNLIQGNYIGTDVTGGSAIKNTQYGIYVSGAARNTIGGTSAGTGNLISGNDLAGIFVQGAGSAGTRIFGNQIGTSATTGLTGIPNGGGVAGVGGVQLLNTAGVLIGFTQVSGTTDPAFANTIAFNTGTGITVSGGTGAGIYGNSIFSNTGLGIALTANGNGGITAPFITAVDTTPTSTLISGQFLGTPGTTYRLQFFSNTSINASGREGRTFLGEAPVTSTGGFTNFNVSIPVTVATGLQVTATLTQGPLTVNNTSQFSNSQPAQVSTRPDLAVSIATTPATILTGQTFSYDITVANTGPTAAFNAVLSQQLPTGVQYSLDGGSTYQNTTSSPITFALGNIAPNTSTLVTILIKAPISTSTVTTTSVVSSSTAETNTANNRATLTKTFSAVADLAVYVTPPTGPIPVGSEFSYIVTLVNAGPNIANNALVKVALPASLTNISVTLDQGTFTVDANNVVTINSGVIPGAFSVPIVITATATQVGTFDATGTVTESTGEFDPNLANNTSTASITVARSADLGISIGVATDPVLIGGKIVYGISITNNGPSDATAPILTDVVPAGLFFVPGESALSQGTLSFDGTQVIGDIGMIASGATVTGFLVFTPTTAGLVTNTVSVTNSPDVDTIPSNNSATTTVAVSPAALGIVVVPPTNPVLLNVPATYTILVTNGGPGAAPDVVLTDLIGALGNVANVAVSQGDFSIFGNLVTANLGLLASGQTATVTVVVTPLVSGVLTNTAAVSTSGYDPNAADNAVVSTSLISPVDLAISTTATTTPVLVGDLASYVITITNNGPALASNVVLTNALPANSTLVSILLPSGGPVIATPVGSNVQIINVGSLASGASASYIFTVRPTSVGSLVNTATVTSSNFDTNAVNNTSQSTVASFNLPGTLQFNTGVAAVNENGGSITFTVNRTVGTLGTVTVGYSTVNLTALAGVNYVATSGTLTFLQGEESKTITVPILDDGIIGGNLDFVLRLSSPTGGASIGALSGVQVTVVNTDRDTIPPQVSSVQPIQTAQGITGFVITFNDAMDPTRAELLVNYAVTLSGRDPGRGAGSVVAIQSATYNATSRTVTLLTVGTLPSNRFYQVNINGSTGLPLTDTSGNVLDGTSTGVAGRNYLTTIGQGTSLRYLDGNGNLVTITLKRGGTMTIIRAASGNASTIALSNIVARRSILSGNRVRTKASTSGRVEIGTITGLNRFGDVRSNLTTAPFFATFAPVSVNGEVLSTAAISASRVSKLSRAAVVSSVVPSGPSWF